MWNASIGSTRVKGENEYFEELREVVKLAYTQLDINKEKHKDNVVYFE